MDGVTETDDARARVPGAVQSVDRALDLLEALARSDVPRGVGEIAALTGLPQGTAHRLLRSLQARGYVRHDATRKYSLGAAAFRLGDAAQRSLARSAGPYLARLVDHSGETANLSVLEGDDVVYVAQVPSPHTLRMFAEVGRHVPPHTTASGKVLLAALPPERAAAVLRRTGLPRHTENTLTDLRELLAELDRTRDRGWAADEEEHETGVRCVAVPVGRGADVVAALSLSGPAERFAGSGRPGLVEEMARVAHLFAVEVMGAEPEGGS
ncbi:MAG: IclR family transcriptional regulator [Actinomycetes bacterium]